MECQQQQIATAMGWWRKATSLVDLFVLPARLLAAFLEDKDEFSSVCSIGRLRHLNSS